MTKIDWKQKLTSRKFWAFIIGIVLIAIIFFFGDHLTVMQVGVIEKAIYVIIAYIFGESAVDVAKAIRNADTNHNGTIEINELIGAVATEIAEKMQSVIEATKEGDGSK
jgi:ABC-type Na+ efflux pump permease subunit